MSCGFSGSPPPPLGFKICCRWLKHVLCSEYEFRHAEDAIIHNEQSNAWQLISNNAIACLWLAATRHEIILEMYVHAAPPPTKMRRRRRQFCVGAPPPPDNFNRRAAAGHETPASGSGYNTPLSAQQREQAGELNSGVPLVLKFLNFLKFHLCPEFVLKY